MFTQKCFWQCFCVEVDKWNKHFHQDHNHEVIEKRSMERQEHSGVVTVMWLL